MWLEKGAKSREKVFVISESELDPDGLFALLKNEM